MNMTWMRYCRSSLMIASWTYQEALTLGDGEPLGRNRFERAVSVGSKVYRMLIMVKTVTGWLERWGSLSGL